MVRLCVHWLAISAVAAIVGCSRNVYEVEMRPNGDAIERDITTWREDTGNVRLEGAPESKPGENIQAISLAELQRIAGYYGEAVPFPTAKKHRFSDEFRGALPNDIGGAGSFTRWQSSLGDLYVYVERARGNDDLVADLDARRAAFDRLVDILIGWLDQELKDDPIAPKLHALLDGPVRRDVSNLLLDAWSTAAAHRNQSLDGQDAVLHDYLFRSSQYLIERDYFAPDDMPHIVRVLQETTEPERNEQLLAIISAAAARKLKLEDDEQLAGLMALLGDQTRLERTLVAYIETTPEFAQKVIVSRVMAALGMPAREVNAGDVGGDFLFQILRMNLLTPSDRLRAKLHVAVPPAATNGRYDADAGTVTWERAIEPADAEFAGFPQLLFAAWAEPNEAEQTRHFGKVILRDEPLARYVFWHRGLIDAEQILWSQFLDTLRPGAGMQQSVSTFRFPADATKADEEAGDLAQTARNLLLDAMKQHGLD